MAKLEKANLKGEIIIHGNLSGTVGPGGRNERNDVLLIQALFQVAASNNRIITKELFGLERPGYLPAVTGNLDLATIEAIWRFQVYNARRLLGVDGIIHPASYEKREIKEPYLKPVMMITLLNMKAQSSADYRFKGDIASAIKSFAPSIFFV